MQSTSPWAEELRARDGQSPQVDESEKPEHDSAFFGELSLLSTDQGVRAILAVMNDFLVYKVEDLELSSWSWSGKATEDNERDIDQALIELSQMKSLADLVNSTSYALAVFDWRTAGFFPSSDIEHRRQQGAFRGSSGYKLLRDSIMDQLARQSGEVGELASALH